MRFSIVPIDPDTFSIFDTSQVETAEIYEAGTSNLITDSFAVEGVSVYFTLPDSINTMIDIYINGEKQMSNHSIIGNDVIQDFAVVSSASPTQNNIAMFDSDGNIADTGQNYTEVATQTDIDQKADNTSQRAEKTSLVDIDTFYTNDDSFITKANLFAEYYTKTELDSFLNNKALKIMQRTDTSDIPDSDRPSTFVSVYNDNASSNKELRMDLDDFAMELNDIITGQTNTLSGEIYVNSDEANHGSSSYLSSKLDTGIFEALDPDEDSTYYLSIKQNAEIRGSIISDAQWGYLGNITKQPLESASEINHNEISNISSDDHHARYSLSEDLSTNEITQIQNIDGQSISWINVATIDQSLSKTAQVEHDTVEANSFTQNGVEIVSAENLSQYLSIFANSLENWENSSGSISQNSTQIVFNSGDAVLKRYCNELFNSTSKTKLKTKLRLNSVGEISASQGDIAKFYSLSTHDTSSNTWGILIEMEYSDVAGRSVNDVYIVVVDSSGVEHTKSVLSDIGEGVYISADIKADIPNDVIIYDINGTTGSWDISSYAINTNNGMGNMELSVSGGLSPSISCYWQERTHY